MRIVPIDLPLRSFGVTTYMSPDCWCQDATYKLKTRGRHTTEAELKSLGKDSGRCMMCGVALEDDTARARGIGSSCAKKHGMS